MSENSRGGVNFMKKIELLEVQQKGVTFYLMSHDPREIIQFVDFPESHTVQVNQRPWSLKRAKEISQYVAGKVNLDFSKNPGKIKAKGIIPNCPILNIRGTLEINELEGRKYLFLPEDVNSIHKAHGDIEILDGQHRLIAFAKDYIDKDFGNIEYTMGYVVFDNLQMEEKKEIFIVTNEKQEKVEKNVLRNLMRWLGLLTTEEEETDKLVIELNDPPSPIAGRISIQGERITRGFKLIQIQKILNKSRTIDTLKGATHDQRLRTLIDYLKAWEVLFPDKFNNPSHIFGKISGLRYIFYLFPYIIDILKQQQKSANIEHFIEVLQVLQKEKLNQNFFEKGNQDQLLFRAETSTIALARNHGHFLVDYFTRDSGFKLFE